MDVVQHQILSLDFWQDTVSYEGKNFPSGTIGCDALNIPAALIKQITELCGSLNLFMGAIQLGMANAELFTSARESALQIVHKLKDIPPFSYLDEKQITAYIQKVFSNEYLENAMAYAKSLASGNLLNALDPQYQKALTLLRVVPVLAHLGYSLEQFQDTMLQFAESLNTAEQERSPSGYAASFGDFFSSNLPPSHPLPVFLWTFPHTSANQVILRLHHHAIFSIKYPHGRLLNYCYLLFHVTA